MLTLHIKTTGCNGIRHLRLQWNEHCIWNESNDSLCDLSFGWITLWTEGIHTNSYSTLFLWEVSLKQSKNDVIRMPIQSNQKTINEYIRMKTKCWNYCIQTIMLKSSIFVRKKLEINLYSILMTLTERVSIWD